MRGALIGPLCLVLAAVFIYLAAEALPEEHDGYPRLQWALVAVYSAAAVLSTVLVGLTW